MPLRTQISSAQITSIAHAAGFELAGVALAAPVEDFGLYQQWISRGLAGKMTYLSDHRAGLRQDPRLLLPSARSIICVGKLYNGPQPYSIERSSIELGWISRYAWGLDYHDVLRRGMEQMARKLLECVSFEYRILVDTAPLLERSYARQAGLGWIGKNTCLINQGMGSWFFLGEMLVSLELEPDAPPPDRCGSCTRCIDACPTKAIVRRPPDVGPEWELDAGLCISYFTIELRGPIPREKREGIGRHVFGCDICQDVCPWNRKAAVTEDDAFAPRWEAPPLEKLAGISKQEFREIFRPTPVSRARYSGFLRNVAVAMGNSGNEQFRSPLERLAASQDAVVAEHARWALARLRDNQ